MCILKFLNNFTDASRWEAHTWLPINGWSYCAELHTLDGNIREMVIMKLTVPHCFFLAPLQADNSSPSPLRCINRGDCASSRGSFRAGSMNKAPGSITSTTRHNRAADLSVKWGKAVSFAFAEKNLSYFSLHRTKENRHRNFRCVYTVFRKRQKSYTYSPSLSFSTRQMETDGGKLGACLLFDRFSSLEQTIIKGWFSAASPEVLWMEGLGHAKTCSAAGC